MTQAQKSPPSPDITSQDLKSAEKIALSLHAAFKHYSLYPGDHPFSQNYLLRLQADLDAYLKDHKSLRLDIENNSFFYHGERLTRESADEGNPAYLLTRDRILFLEFLQNIEQREITLFFDILNKHRNPMEEVDGDIATSLWHTSLNNICYEAADIFAMEAIDFDLSVFKAAPGPGDPDSDGNGTGTAGYGGNGDEPEGTGSGNQDSGGHHYTDGHDSSASPGMSGTAAPDPERLDRSSPGLLMVAKENDLAELTYQEKFALESYILEEEGKNIANDTIDILLIILSIESDQLEFATILDFLEYEFFEAMAGEEYGMAHKICNNVNNISSALTTKKPWAISLINIFFASLANEERCAQLPLVSEEELFAPDPDQLKKILSIFDTLPPEIMFTLAVLVERTEPDNLRQRNELLEIIGKKARQEPASFLKLIAKSSEEICLLLFPIAEGMKSGDAAPIFAEMTQHPSAVIRRVGLDGLFQEKSAADPEQLVHLLDDEDEQIRQRILSYLESVGGRLAEETLIGFLNSSAKVDDQLHILECYKLLGQCLSDHSLHFLHEVLLESKLTSVLNKMNMTHKKGAAYALRSSGNRKAMDILRKGADSIRPDVRHVCQKALG